jgi:hypothetical protein
LSFLTLTLSQTLKNVIIFGHEGLPPIVHALPTPPPHRSCVAFLDQILVNALPEESNPQNPPESEEDAVQSVCILLIFQDLIVIEQTL